MQAGLKRIVFIGLLRLLRLLLPPARMLMRAGIPGARRVFWELQAPGQYLEWNGQQGDYAIVREALAATRAVSVLEIGCGTGRYFPLYAAHKHLRVVATDVSRLALCIARLAQPASGIRLRRLPVNGLDRLDEQFDLVISNRVLSAVPEKEIDVVIAALIRRASAVLVNEMSNSDRQPESDYWFCHDYASMFAAHGWQRVHGGCNGRQTWHVFAKERCDERPVLQI